MSLLSQVTYTQSVSGNRLFTVPFQYLNKLHISVEVDGAPVSFDWLDDTTVELDVAPDVGAEVFIQRLTQRNELIVQFTDASTLTASALNVGNKQALYVVQEAGDLSEIAEQVAAEASDTANDADSKADSAITTANNADGKADTAISDSAAALTTANNADDKSDTAISDSAAAVITANDADSKADAAVLTANDADSKVDAAVLTANDADSKADEAILTADEALTTAEALTNVDASDILFGADNLSKVADVGAARTKLDVYSKAEVDTVAADLLETNPVTLNLSSAADFDNGGPILLRRIGDLVTAYIGRAFHPAAAVRGAAQIIPAGWRPASNLDIDWLTNPTTYVSIPERDIGFNIVGEDYKVYVEVTADGDVLIAYYNPDGTPRADQQESPTVSLSWICIPT